MRGPVLQRQRHSLLAGGAQQKWFALVPSQFATEKHEFAVEKADNSDLIVIGPISNSHGN
jgi:hypothetical protein